MKETNKNEMKTTSQHGLLYWYEWTSINNIMGGKWCTKIVCIKSEQHKKLSNSFNWRNVFLILTKQNSKWKKRTFSFPPLHILLNASQQKIKINSRGKVSLDVINSTHTPNTNRVHNFKITFVNGHNDGAAL